MRPIEASFIVLTTKNVFLYVTPYSLVEICMVLAEPAESILKVN